MCNLFNLLLNPLLISHRKDLNFGRACKQTWTPGISSLQLVSRWVQKEDGIQSSPSYHVQALRSFPVFPPSSHCCAQLGSKKGLREPHTSPSLEVHSQSRPFPFSVVFICHSCKQLFRSVPEARLSRCCKCVTHTVFTNSPEQYISATHSFPGLTKSFPTGGQVL